MIFPAGVPNHSNQKVKSLTKSETDADNTHNQIWYNNNIEYIVSPMILRKIKCHIKRLSHPLKSWENPPMTFKKKLFVVIALIQDSLLPQDP